MSNLSSLHTIPTPAYVIDRQKVRDNLAVAARIKAETGCKILLATKAFACTALFEDFAQRLDGTTASGIYEARLGHEHFGGEVHAYSPAYTDAELEALAPICDHLYFNSVRQLEHYLSLPLKGGGDINRGRGIQLGLRLNPQLSLVKNSTLYDPSAPHSRFGVKKEELTPEVLAKIDILHVHNLCENMAEDSVALVDHLMATVPEALDAMVAVNLGGGHYFTHPDYDVEALIAAINRLQSAHDVQVILEPGGALVYDAGYLVASVVDVLGDHLSHGERSQRPSEATDDAGEGAKPVAHRLQHPSQHPHPKDADALSTSPSGRGDIAILDTSATCHMPDVLEVPYTPEVVGADSTTNQSPPKGSGHTYQLTGKTCLTGDIIGTYQFLKPLQPGDRVIFKDMAQYTMVKNTTFNGMPLPDIGVLEVDGSYRLLKRFGYEDFWERVG